MRKLFGLFCFFISISLLAGCAALSRKEAGPTYSNGALTFVPVSVDKYRDHCLFSGTATIGDNSWPEKILSIGPGCESYFIEPHVVFVDYDVELNAGELWSVLGVLEISIKQNCRNSSEDIVISCLADAVPRYISRTRRGYRVAYVMPSNLQGKGIGLEVFRVGAGFGFEPPPETH